MTFWWAIATALGRPVVPELFDELVEEGEMGAGGVEIPEAEESANVLVLLVEGDLVRGDLVVWAIVLAYGSEIFDGLEAFQLAFEEEDVASRDAGVLRGL